MEPFGCLLMSYCASWGTVGHKKTSKWLHEATAASGKNATLSKQGYLLRGIDILFSLSTTANMVCQLLRQRACQKISVMKKTNSGVFISFKTKHELKCQNELET